MTVSRQCSLGRRLGEVQDLAHLGGETQRDGDRSLPPGYLPPGGALLSKEQASLSGHCTAHWALVTEGQLRPGDPDVGTMALPQQGCS